MADTITITLPDRTMVSLTPNPVNTNAALKISVKATEIRQILYPEWFYSGEIYTGEE